MLSTYIAFTLHSQNLQSISTLLYSSLLAFIFSEFASLYFSHLLGICEDCRFSLAFAFHSCVSIFQYMFVLFEFGKSHTYPFHQSSLSIYNKYYRFCPYPCSLNMLIYLPFKPLLKKEQQQQQQQPSKHLPVHYITPNQTISLHPNPSCLKTPQFITIHLKNPNRLNTPQFITKTILQYN